MELLSGHLPSAHPEECPDANPGAKAAGGPALPGEQVEMEGRSLEGYMVGSGSRTGQDRERTPRQTSHSSLTPSRDLCRAGQSLVLQERNLSLVLNNVSLAT